MRIFLLALLVLFSSLAHDVHAASSVVINELMVHPESGNDWIELYNNGSDVDLSGWQLKDTGSTSLKTLSGILAANAYLVIEVTNRLNNSGDTVSLVDGTNASIDSYSYSSDPGLNKSLGRDPNGTGNFGLLVESSRGLQNGSAQAQPANTAPPATNSPLSSSPPVGGATAITGISLSEFLPAPNSGEDEWVEIYNSNDVEVNLGGWQIDDEEGGSAPFVIPSEGNSAFIPPKSYKVYIMPSARFNNSGDKVRLIRPDGSLADETSYVDAKSGVSFAKDQNGQWQQTTTSTISGENVITAPANELVSSQSNKPVSTKSPTTKSSAPQPTTLGISTANGSYRPLLGGGTSSGKQDHNLGLPILSLFASKSASRSSVPKSYVKKSFIDIKTPYIASAVAVGVLGVAFWFVKVHKRKEDVL